MNWLHDSEKIKKKRCNWQQNYVYMYKYRGMIKYMVVCYKID